MKSGYKKIQLGGHRSDSKNKCYAIVDVGDFEAVSQFKWSLCHGYAQRGMMVNGRMTWVAMHREIIGGKPNMVIDHINHNTIDNRRSNLRLCTNSQNQFNRGVPINNTSGYKGVYFNKKDKRWGAYMSLNKKMKMLGYFGTKEEAAIAYREHARKVQGDFIHHSLK